MLRIAFVLAFAATIAWAGSQAAHSAKTSLIASMERTHAAG